jgi:hypothetical protein
MSERVTLYLHPRCDHCAHVKTQFPMDVVQRVVNSIEEHNHIQDFPLHLKNRVPTLEVVRGTEGKLFPGARCVTNEIIRRLKAWDERQQVLQEEASAQAQKKHQQQQNPNLQGFDGGLTGMENEGQLVGGLCQIDPPTDNQYNDKKLTKQEIDNIIQQQQAEDEAFFKAAAIKAKMRRQENPTEQIGLETH